MFGKSKAILEESNEQFRLENERLKAENESLKQKLDMLQQSEASSQITLSENRLKTAKLTQCWAVVAIALNRFNMT